MEARDESEESEEEEAHPLSHTPSRRPQQESDETAAGDAEVRDGSEEEAERETIPPPRKPQAHQHPARTKGLDFSSCF